MANPDFEIVPFVFQPAQDERGVQAWEAWEGERRGGGASPRPARASRAVPARPQRRPPPPRPSPRPRPRPPALRRPLDASRFVGWPDTREPAEPREPCICPAHGTEYVRWVQSALNRIEGLALPVDGVMSAAARSALRGFQGRNNLAVDGIAGPDTEQALRDAGRPADAGSAQPAPAAEEGESYEFESLEFESSTSPSTRSTMPTLRKGARGTAVADLQRRLAAAGFSAGAVDGIFGSLTDAAVRSFQRARRLLVDGVVGPQTWGALPRAAPGTPGGGAPAVPATPYPAPPTAPASGLRARIVQAALQEWQRWGNGSVTESDPAMRSVLENYWRAATGAPPPAANWWEPYWSAVFISWVMRQAGAGNQFAYSSAHTDYVAAAKRNRIAGNSNPFKAYRISEMALRPGDLVCAERSSSGVTYDNVDDGRFRSSHCDVVVEAQAGRIVVVGGNVSDTVGRKTISVDSAGKLLGSPYYAVLRSGA